LEFQPALASAIRQRLDASVIAVAAAIENDLLNTLGLGRFGDRLADFFRRVLVSAGFERAGQGLCLRADGAQRSTRHVVDHLRIDLIQAAEYAESRPLRRAEHRSADPQLAALLLGSFFLDC